MAEKAQTTKKTTAAKPKAVAPKAVAGLSVSLFNTAGKESGTIMLPKELFGVEVNKDLLNQYVYVYRMNQRQGTVSTKTRSEVRGTTKKIYRQKGTGGARHGARKAPIFVGGGVTFGPKPRVIVRNLSKKMKKQALASALSYALTEQKVAGVQDTVLSMEAKTKNVVAWLKNAGLSAKKVLFVLPTEKAELFVRASRNLGQITCVAANQINAYEVLKAPKIVFVESAVTKMVEHFASSEEK